MAIELAEQHEEKVIHAIITTTKVYSALPDLSVGRDAYLCQWV